MFPLHEDYRLKDSLFYNESFCRSVSKRKSTPNSTKNQQSTEVKRVLKPGSFEFQIILLWEQAFDSGWEMAVQVLEIQCIPETDSAEHSNLFYENLRDETNHGSVMHGILILFPVYFLSHS